jgi:hypothetical protein
MTEERPRNLTPKMWEVLQFIRAEIDAGHPFPSREAIAKHMGWSHKNSANDAMRALIGNKYVKRIYLKSKTPGRRRAGFVYTLSEPPRI